MGEERKKELLMESFGGRKKSRKERVKINDDTI